MTEAIAILGSSRGIGAAIARLYHERDYRLFLASRRWKSEEFPGSTKFSCDFTRADEREALLQNLEAFAPTRVFYVAGGGPWGKFESKEFKDHIWAIELGLVAPAQVLHWALSNSMVKQFIAFGSAIAEDSDAFASSYSAAKSGLVGLIKSVRAENSQKDIRLYSPGYVATDLLPKSAQATRKVLSPQQVAEDFSTWADSATAEAFRSFLPS